METTAPAPTQEDIALWQKWVKIGHLAQGISWLSGIASMIIFFMAINRQLDTTCVKLVALAIYLMGITAVNVSLWGYWTIRNCSKNGQAPVSWNIMGKDFLAEGNNTLVFIIYLPLTLVFLAPTELSSWLGFSWLLFGTLGDVLLPFPQKSSSINKGEQEAKEPASRDEHFSHKYGLVIVKVLIYLGLFVPLVFKLFT